MTNRPTIEPAELVNELASRMRERDLKWEQSKPWTSALKDCLRCMLENEDNKVTDVLYSDSAKGRHEFLLDVVVWNRSSDSEGVTLAVESEWSQNVDEVEADFWKLLVVKAPVKLMIFACNKNPRKFSQEAIWDRLSDCIGRYRDHTPGERYVFMDYAPPPARRAWWVKIPENGILQSVPERNWLEFE